MEKGKVDENQGIMAKFWITDLLQQGLAQALPHPCQKQRDFKQFPAYWSGKRWRDRIASWPENRFVA